MGSMRSDLKAPVRLETERLIVRMADESDAGAILDFCLRNQKHLEPTSPKKVEGFYTEPFWIERIQKAKEAFQAETSLNLYLFTKGADQNVVGTVSFTQMFRGPFQACYLGYGIDRECEGKGLMFEGTKESVRFVFDELNFHRLMANHLPENKRSANLLKRLGFLVEGTAPEYLLINGEWRDHVLNSLTNRNWRTL